MAQVLVTGGCGFLGERLCYALLSQGIQIVVVDNLSADNADALQRLISCGGGRLKVELGDCCNVARMEEVFGKCRPDVAIHLAAFVDAAESVRAPLKYYRNNVGATIGFLAGATNSGCKKLVFSSSASVYGASNLRVNELSGLVPVSPHASSKAIAERMFVDVVGALQETSVSILRYFNLVGAVTRRAVFSGPSEFVALPLFARVCRVAAGVEPVLDVYEPPIPTRDGSCVRDFIYVDDLISAHLAVLQEGRCRKSQVEIFNVGSGRGYSVNEVIDSFEEVLGKPVNTRSAPPRLGDIAFSVADVATIESEIGWRATKGLDAMCRDTWNEFERLRQSTVRP